MLENITWKQFLIFLTASFLIYYAAAILLLIRQWVKAQQAPNGKKRILLPKLEEVKDIIKDPVHDPQSNSANKGKLTENDADEDDPVMTSIEKFGAELENITYESAGQENKTVVLDALRYTLDQYPELRMASLKSALISTILSKLNNETNINLSREEIEQLWDAQPESKT